MQVLLLATGESAKLQPITEMMPISLLPIANRPLMLYPIELLARQGQKQLFVALYEQAGHIESYFGNGERWGVKLHYLLQRGASGNGGAVKQAAAIWQDEPLLVVPGDVIIDYDVSEVMAFHQERQALVTMVVHAENCSNGHKIKVDGEGRVQMMGEQENDSHTQYSTGLYLLSPQVLRMIPAGKHCDIYEHLLPQLLAEKSPVYAYQSNGYWNSLSSFAAYYETQASLLSGDNHQNHPEPSLKPHWIQSRMVANGVWIGRNNIIHPTARLQPPVMIGDNCYIGQEAQLGPNMIVGNNVIIDEEATVTDSTILDGTYVGQLVKLEKRLVNKGLVVDFSSGEAVQITDAFLVGRAFQTVSESGLFQFVGKAAALLMLLLSSWLMALIGLLLWLTGGRVFTKEAYYHGDVRGVPAGGTFNMSPLPLWQFVTTDRKGRVTIWGRWLRRWDLYRLPHLWHVVSGDLALVGVKPLTEGEAASITEEWQQKRFEQMPGFTGLWYVQPQQVGGIDGILVADTYYAVTQSWQLDVKTFGQTFLAWWRRGRQEKGS